MTRASRREGIRAVEGTGRQSEPVFTESSQCFSQLKDTNGQVDSRASYVEQEPPSAGSQALDGNMLQGCGAPSVNSPASAQGSSKTPTVE